MQTCLLKPTEYQTMPWKNGHGVTHEIAAERSEEDLRAGTFLWRLSMAEVQASAPFSSFPGVDRIILLLEGDGMVLQRGTTGRHVLAKKYEPYAFPGEWSIDGRLLGGPCRDFNVMVDRLRARAEVAVVPMGAEPQLVSSAGRTVAIFTLSGTLHATIGARQPVYEVPARHTLLVTAQLEPVAPPDVLLAAGTDEATALLVSFTRLRR
jgi:environmental stress-induced protein Ves